MKMSQELEKLIGNGVYISTGNHNLAWPEGLDEKKPRINQSVVCEYDSGGETINRKVEDVIIPATFDFSRLIKSPRDFLAYLNVLAIKWYCWNSMGGISRPTRLKVDPKSVGLEIYDVVRINSERDGRYTVAFFGLKFKARGTAQYGGEVGGPFDDKGYDELKAWAKETLPHLGKED